MLTQAYFWVKMREKKKNIFARGCEDHKNVIL